MNSSSTRLFAAAAVAAAIASEAAQAAQPIKALLLTGGCCHDYAAQKDILKTGLESRLNIRVDIIHTPDGSTKPPLPIYGNPDYAKGYDIVIHDECAADVNTESVVEGVLKPHRDGIPGVNLHCAMHCYRIGNPNDPATPGTPHAYWFDYLGLQSSGHGAQTPISLTFLPADNPITKGMADWTTIHEELYNNIKIWPETVPLIKGKQGAGDKPGQNNTVVAWEHEYGAKKTRVFSTTVGHNNETVQDPRYLDLVARGVLWATGHINPDGTPAPGYGPAAK
jgi:Trehalose utilisation